MAQRWRDQNENGLTENWQKVTENMVMATLQYRTSVIETNPDWTIVKNVRKGSAGIRRGRYIKTAIENIIK